MLRWRSKMPHESALPFGQACFLGNCPARGYLHAQSVSVPAPTFAGGELTRSSYFWDEFFLPCVVFLVDMVSPICSPRSTARPTVRFLPICSLAPPAHSASLLLRPRCLFLSIPVGCGARLVNRYDYWPTKAGPDADAAGEEFYSLEACYPPVDHFEDDLD